MRQPFASSYAAGQTADVRVAWPVFFGARTVTVTPGNRSCKGKAPMSLSIDRALSVLFWCLAIEGGMLIATTSLEGTLRGLAASGVVLVALMALLWR
jgi:hypothetical protein